jgi:hypothetical protein
MTQDQQVAISHWAMYGSNGAPVHRRGGKWWVSTDETSCLRVRAYYLPNNQARIELHDGNSMLESWPSEAYRIWNYNAHLEDIVNEKLETERAK